MASLNARRYVIAYSPLKICVVIRRKMPLPASYSWRERRLPSGQLLFELRSIDCPRRGSTFCCREDRELDALPITKDRV